MKEGNDDETVCLEGNLEHAFGSNDGDRVAVDVAWM